MLLTAISELMGTIRMSNVVLCPGRRGVGGWARVDRMSWSGWLGWSGWPGWLAGCVGWLGLVGGGRCADALG